MARTEVRVVVGGESTKAGECSRLRETVDGCGGGAAWLLLAVGRVDGSAAARRSDAPSPAAARHTDSQTTSVAEASSFALLTERFKIQMRCKQSLEI